MTVISNNEPLKGMGKVLYGDIDDLITFLALVPDEQLRVKLWERSLEKQIGKYKHLCAIRDFRDSFEIPEGQKPKDQESVKKEIVNISKRIASDIEEVKNTLGINLTPEYVDDWAWVFTYIDKNPILLKAIAGDNPRIGGKFLRVLTERQIEFLFNELTRERKIMSFGKIHFMEGSFGDFKEMFAGKGIDPESFKHMNWVDSNKITFRQLIWGQTPSEGDPETVIGLKSKCLKERDIPKVAQTFFKYRGEPFPGTVIKGDQRKSDDRVSEINKILKGLATIED